MHPRRPAFASFFDHEIQALEQRLELRMRERDRRAMAGVEEVK